MSRRLKGKFELKEDDENNKFVDSVGCFGDWKKAGPRFYLPYSILFGKCKNLLVAGRCISADEKAGDVTRAIPVCALSGEVCGKAAGIKINNNLKSVQEVDAEKLREKMIQNNNILK